MFRTVEKEKTRAGAAFPKKTLLTPSGPQAMFAFNFSRIFNRSYFLTATLFKVSLLASLIVQIESRVCHKHSQSNRYGSYNALNRFEPFRSCRTKQKLFSKASDLLVDFAKTAGLGQFVFINLEITLCGYLDLLFV